VTISLLASVALALVGPGTAAPQTPEAALVQRLKLWQARTRDLSARFTQTYRSSALGNEVKESGDLRLKFPGRMRWEYRDPEKKTFVADGTRFYFYVPADRQVIIQDQGQDRGLAARLLTGQIDLSREFEGQVKPEAPDTLVLKPREASSEVELLTIGLDLQGRVVSIIIQDVQGNVSRFVFDRFHENTGLPDWMFRFETPPGVEVITG
jgi:outer membrane lipoprotein carrier protein